jgi:hypothetical protein
LWQIKQETMKKKKKKRKTKNKIITKKEAKMK